MKQGDPLVSVVMATHNRAALLRKAVESVLGQTEKNVELLIVDDASGDATAEVLEKYAAKDSRVRVLRNDLNIGLIKSLNKALKKAKGKYVARIDDDDIWCDPEKLTKQVSLLESHPEYVLVGGGTIRVDLMGKEFLHLLPPQEDQEIRKVMLQFNPFAHSTILFRRSAWEGGYDERLESSASGDWDLWMRLGKKGKLYNFPEYFARCLETGQNLSHQKFLHNARVTLALRLKYRNDYPNFSQGYLRGLISLLLALLPFHFFLRRLFWRMSTKVVR